MGIIQGKSVIAHDQSGHFKRKEQMSKMKLIKKIASVLLIAALFITFSPVSDGGQAYAASVKLNKKTVYMLKGKTYKLKVKGTRAKVKWKSSDKKVVTVSKKGKLKAKGYGKAVVTAKVKGKTLKCTVRVERKTERNARKLRNYILKKGKKSGSKRVIRKIIKSDASEGSRSEYSITASKKDKKLVFFTRESTTEPPETTEVTITIDLISGSAAVRTGKSTVVYYDGYSEGSHSHTYADITTKFKETYSGGTNTVTGYKITKHEEYYDDVLDTTVTDPATLSETEFMRFSAANIGDSFISWDKLMAGHKTLKKAKINMKSIGFKNWK